MSDYYRAEDVQELITACTWRMTLAKEINGEGFVEYDKQVLDVGELKKGLKSLPTIEVSEDDGLKFYYVDSIDDYWIGQRLDNFYYAKWNSKLGFVWSASRYLPWGEHIVDENTLWKEHTYPSEPREIPFTEWIVGFMKKYGSKVSEDCSDYYKGYCSKYDDGCFHQCEDAISREWLMKRWDEMSVRGRTEFDQEIMVASSVIPQPKEGEWVDTCEDPKHEHPMTARWYRCSECGHEGNTKFPCCPICGSRMKGAEE